MPSASEQNRDAIVNRRHLIWPSPLAGRLGPVIFILLALGFAFASGPFRSPDEYNHFFRAYEVSRGRLIASRPTADLLGDDLPVSLGETARIVAGFPAVPPVQTIRSQMAAGLKVKLDPKKRSFTAFPGALNSPPGVYFIPAIGIAFGRFIRARPLVLFYLARCCNAVIAGGLIGCAVRRISRSAPFVAALALLPMCLFQTGTLTADATAFAIAFLWCSEVLQARLQNTAPAPLAWWRLLLMAAALSQLKFPYPILGLLVVSFPRHKLGNSRASITRRLSLFFATLFLPSLCWLALLQRIRVQMRPQTEVDPIAQIHFVAGHPLQFLQMIWSEIERAGAGHWHEIIGVLGWLNFPLPGWIVLGISISLGLSICCSNPGKLRLTKSFRVFSLALATTGIFATVLLIYATWNGPGAPRIEGWQGRYAIPFLPVAGIALANPMFYRARWVAQLALLFSIIADVAAIIYLARATYF